MNHRSLSFLIDGSFLILPPHPLHAFHISTFCCTPSTSPLLYACTPILVACVLMGLYFSFLHFTLFRCMIQSRLVAGSTLSRNPSPIASGFVADRFQFASGLFPVLLPTGFRFCLTGRFPVLLDRSGFVTNRFPVSLNRTVSGFA